MQAPVVVLVAELEEDTTELELTFVELELTATELELAFAELELTAELELATAELDDTMAELLELAVAEQAVGNHHQVSAALEFTQAAAVPRAGLNV